MSTLPDTKLSGMWTMMASPFVPPPLLRQLHSSQNESMQSVVT